MKSMKKWISSMIAGALLIGILPMNIQVAEAAVAAFSGWTVQAVGNAEIQYEVQPGAGVGGSNALFMSKKPTVIGTNVYGMAMCTVPVKKDTAYAYGFKMKLVNADKVVSRIDWVSGYAKTVTASGRTFDWKNFDYTYTHTTDAASVVMRFLVEQSAEAVYLDDVYFYELDENGERVGINLVTNGTFDVSSKASAVLGDTFTFEEFEAVAGVSPGLPVQARTEEIVVDGDLSDWKNVAPEIHLPYDASQKTVLNSKLPSDDLSAEYKIAYDEEYIYYGVAVTDDKKEFKEGSRYWDGDCLQVAICNLDETYGNEFGFSVGNHTDGNLYIVSRDGFATDEILAKYSQREDGVDYEVAIPWKLIRDERPAVQKYSIAIADADGEGRKMAIEVAPGLVTGKNNSKFPLMYLMDKNRDFVAWTSGAESVIVDAETGLEAYILNFGEEAEFEISSSFMDNKTVTIPANAGIKMEAKEVFEQLGENTIDLIVKKGEDELRSSFTFQVLADRATTEKIYKDITEKLAELKELREECHKKGITTDYEDSDIRIIEEIGGWFLDDLRVNFYDNVGYKAQCLENLYQKTKKALNAYLSGEKESLAVPRYAGGGIKVDGANYYADMKLGDTIEKSPMFVIGYGQFEDAFCSANFFSEYGMNGNVVDPQFQEIMKKAYEPAAWAVTYTNGADADVTIEEDEAGEKYLQIVNRSSSADGGKYVRLRQIVLLEAGKEYEFGITSNCDNATSSITFGLNLIDYPPISNNVSATKAIGEQKTFGYFKAYEAEGRYSLTIDVKEPGVIKLDDIYVREKGTSKNILQNGDCSAFVQPAYTGADYGVDMLRMEHYLERLEFVAESGCVASVGLGMNYPPSFLTVKYPQYSKGYGSFIPYNYHAEEIRPYVKEYLKAIVSLLKDCKGVCDVYIYNEPDWDCKVDPEYFLPLYHDFLKEKYGTIEALNEAYGTDYGNFAVIEMPKDYIADSLYFYDYSRFNTGILYDIFEYSYDAAKETAPEMNISVGKLTIHNGYADSPAYLSRGEATFEDYGRVSDVFGCDAYSCYFKRTEQPIDGKMMIYDLASNLTGLPVANTEDHVQTDKIGQYPMDVVGQNISTDIWNGCFHNRAESLIWIYANTYSPSSYRWGGIGMRPDALSLVNKAALDANRLAKEITAVKDREADVLMLYSEASRHYNRGYLNTSYYPYIAALRNGLKVEFAGETQLEKINADKYKLLVIPNAVNVKRETLERILSYVKDGGKLILMGEDSLKFDEENRPHDTAIVNEIHNNVAYYLPVVMNAGGTAALSPNGDEAEAALVHMAKELGMLKVQVVDATTGEKIDTVEYEVGEYDGSVLVNITNYEWVDRDVKIYLNGEVVKTMTEMRDNEAYNEVITLKGHVPAFVKLK